jgi:hypothetical protein
VALVVVFSVADMSSHRAFSMDKITTSFASKTLQFRRSSRGRAVFIADSSMFLSLDSLQSYAS